MAAFFVIFGIFVWASIGWIGGLYGWLRQFDLELSDAFFIGFFGMILGPIFAIIVICNSIEWAGGKKVLIKRISR